MGSPVGLLVRLLSVMLALVALLALSAAQATGAKAKGGTDPGCTWGASSVRAEVVDSRIVASEPTVTGCIP
jgi:hypothetical protein